MAARLKIARLGLPEMSDVVGQYRLHVDCITDGELPRPAQAVLVEFDSSGEPQVFTFGTLNACSRERLNVLTAAVTALGESAQFVNAQGSN